MIWAWGNNNTGRLGNNSTENQSSPVSIARNSSYVKIAAATYNGMAIDGNDGMIWSWGGNYFGQLGNNAAGDRSSPVSMAKKELDITIVSTLR